MTPGTEISRIELPAHLKGSSKTHPLALWGTGNADILCHPLLAIISARQIDGDLERASLQIIKQVAALKNVSFIGGWHSRLEQDCFQILLTEQASLVFCISKALERFKPTAEVKNLITENKALVLTHCTPRAKRISREASIRRNQVVVELAAALLVLSAPVGSASLNLAKAALEARKPVFTLEHHMNRKLLDSSVSVATLDRICAALR